MALQGIMKDKDSGSNLLEWEGKNSKKKKRKKTLRNSNRKKSLQKPA